MAEALHASIDGELLAPGEARISVLDDGLLRGDGVFEAVKLYDDHPFRLGAHLDRLEASGRALHLQFDRPALEQELAAIVTHAPAGDSMLRIVITRGGRRILLVERLPEWPPRASIALVQLSPSEILAGVKSISYAGNMHATRIAGDRGADEAVYFDRDGVVLEAPTSSVFWTSPTGELRTPALQTGILDSITRRVVLAGVACEEGSFTTEDLRSAESAFLASTTREIQPISSIDGADLPDAEGGEAATTAARALQAAVERDRSG